VVRDFGLSGAFGARLVGAGTLDIVIATDGIGNLWGVYGTDAAVDFKVNGLLTSLFDVGIPDPHAHWAASGADWGRPGEWGQPVRIDAHFDAAASEASGTVASAADTRTLVEQGLARTGYRSDDAATIAAVRGRWNLVTSRGSALSMDIADDGSISGMLGRCYLKNSAIKPSASGKNIYAVALSPGACGDVVYGDPVHGFAVVYPSLGGGAQMVIGAWNGWDPVHLAAAGKR
jgi:hypothetical protein